MLGDARAIQKPVADLSGAPRCARAQEYRVRGRYELFRGWSLYSRQPFYGWFAASAVVLGLQIVDALLGLFGVGCRFSRVLRPVLPMIRFSNIRMVLTGMISLLPKILSVLVLLLLNTSTFAFLGHLFFRDYTDPYRQECEILPYDFTRELPGNCTHGATTREDYFETITEAFWQLFILTTTANYPDVMTPARRITPSAPLFFVLFLLIGLFFLMNLLFAVVYEYYKEASVRKAASAQ